jgi:hypothetical protein
MVVNPENKIIQLCTQGVERENLGKPQEALVLFQQAWNEARTTFEKLTASHYLARHQSTVEQKLRWDITALDLAGVVRDKGVKQTLPSLCLNVAKGYENLGDLIKARMHYEKALACTTYLPDDEYTAKIKKGIKERLENLVVKKRSVSVLL